MPAIDEGPRAGGAGVDQRAHQNYDGRADPLARKLEGLRQFLDIDLPKAAAYLVNVQKILEAYSSASAPEGVNAPAPISTSVEPEGTT